MYTSSCAPPQGLDAKAYFNRFAKIFDDTFQNKHLLAKKIYEIIKKTEASHTSDKALDIGIGTGVLWEDNEYYEVTGIDTSEEMLSICERKGSAKHLFNVEADVDEWPVPDNTYGAVVSCATMEHIDNAYPVIKKMINKVQPGGLVLLSYVTAERENYKWHFSPTGAAMHSITKYAHSYDLIKQTVEKNGANIIKNTYDKDWVNSNGVTLTSNIMEITKH